MSENDTTGSDKVPAEKLTEDNAWERNLISRIALQAITEQRRARRWSIFFKSLLALYLFAILLLYLPRDWSQTPVAGGYTALVEIDGVISADSNASADKIVTSLRNAFKDNNAKGVILRINSPGGSPVQAGYIHDEILRLRDEHPDKPVYAVIADTCASGGYYIAVAADKIYANRASIVGSIGVIYSGFGFVDTLDKLGIERRVLTAGENKALLDPFSPLETDAVNHMHNMLENIHQQFISVVREGRGDRLKEDEEELFSGLVWTGERSIELGLVDSLASASEVAREVIGAEKIIDHTVRESYLDRFARQIGTTLANEIEARNFDLR